MSLALSAAGDKISESTIKLMMKIFDTDNSGTIDYYEFERLFRYIQVTRESFESYDYNRNGTLSLEEAFHAISRAKFDFKDASTMRLLCKKFDKGNRGELTFENFLELVMFLGNWVFFFLFFCSLSTSSVLIFQCQNRERCLQCTMPTVMVG